MTSPVYLRDRLVKATTSTLRVLYWVFVGVVAFSIPLPLGFVWLNVESATQIFALTLFKSILTIFSMTIPASITFLGVLSGAKPSETMGVLRYFFTKARLERPVLVIGVMFFVLSLFRLFWVNGIYDGLPFLCGLVSTSLLIGGLTKTYARDCIGQKRKNLASFDQAVNEVHKGVWSRYKAWRFNPTRNTVGIRSITMTLVVSATLVQVAAIYFGLDKKGADLINAIAIMPILLTFVALNAVQKSRNMAHWFSEHQISTRTLESIVSKKA